MTISILQRATDKQAPRQVHPQLFSANDMIDRTAARMRTTRRELLGERSRWFVRGRWAMMLFLRRRGWSFARIGSLLGGLDHSTVVHGVNGAVALCATDLDYKRFCEAIQ